MFTQDTTYNSLVDFIREFADDEACRKHLEHIRWGNPDGSVSPACPHCEHAVKIYSIEGGKRFKCSSCKRKFSVTVATIFENSKISLQKWFLAIWLATSHKKGISSCQLARDLDITQKSAWHMLHRIRETFQEQAPELLENEVQCDEVFIGGKEKWKHADKRTKNNRGRSVKTKVPVFGMTERDGTTRFKVVENTKAATLEAEILPNIKPGSKVYTDEWAAYNGLSEIYDHSVIKHRDGVYVDGDTSTNVIENRWSHFRRTLYGTFHSVSPKHLQRYADESAFRLNTRDMAEGERFDLAISQCEGRLTYDDLIHAPEWVF